MADDILVGIHGVAGRMGRRILALIHEDADLVVAAALETATSPFIGRDAGELAGIGNIGVPITSELTDRVDIIIDFSTPAGLTHIAEICAQRRIGLVAATTGLTAAQRETVLSTSQTAPVVVAPNMSLAVNLTMKLVREAARGLKSYPAGVDVEIIERHHRFKEDAPSGTALRFGEIVAG